MLIKDKRDVIIIFKKKKKKKKVNSVTCNILKKKFISFY